MTTNEPKQQLMVWWILWASFLSGVVVMHQVLVVPAAKEGALPQGGVFWLAGLVPLFASALVRWTVLPRQTTAQAALPFFIIGIAMAEGTFLLGRFVFPAQSMEFFWLAILGVLQYIPFFARRYFE
jgi:hypothetical protein